MEVGHCLVGEEDDLERHFWPEEEGVGEEAAPLSMSGFVLNS